MIMLSREEKYEEAKVKREQIKTLDYITQEKIPEEKFIENPNLAEDIRNKELQDLSTLVKVKNLRRIECFDIAHLTGTSATASMVTFIEGVAEKEYYRHFKVRQEKRQSDYDSMREIVQRRIKNLDRWEAPNLIIVDGGLGQVKIFNEACKNLKIPVVGIAKGPDRLVFPDGTKVKLIGPTLHLVSRIRDEAHRFARRLHHKLVTKALLT
jgi:excinuclease ABC subunit C